MAIPDIFFKVFSTLVNRGYHPRPWKQAIGAILKKPKKPDYSAPKAYRVIALLNCLGKISERILAQRLSFLAETTSLLHESQIGGRLKKSAIDAALLLTNQVQENKALNLKTSTLFLDVKGAFDHVAENQLIQTLIDLNLPLTLIGWIRSFLEKRVLKLSFNGQTEEFKPIETGIPQGSPISPILFLIYIRNLFQPGQSTFLSYIDDITLTVSSTSWKKNAKSLESEASKIYELAAQNSIQFDLSKTELLHWSKAKSARKHALVLPNSERIKTKALVTWLGITFDPNLKFSQHVKIRATQAKQAFSRMARLTNTNKGLSPHAFRQLYLACITSIADYGSIIWYKGQKELIYPLKILQNACLRKILNAFWTTPLIALEIESALPSV